MMTISLFNAGRHPAVRSFNFTRGVPEKAISTMPQNDRIVIKTVNVLQGGRLSDNCKNAE